MRLTDKEKEMLDGKYGYPVQKSMELLTGLGECYGAQRMIPIASAHLIPSLSPLGKGGALFIKDLADRGGKFTVITHTNPLGVDIWSWQYFRTPKDMYKGQLEVDDALKRMDALTCNTCTPYLVGHVPRLGEHLAWNESSAIIFANSVLGARTNREGGPSAVAAGLTGRAPEFGFHLTENRRGNLKIAVTAKLKGHHDYGALGYFTGKLAGNGVPVFTGLPPSASWDDLKQLGAAQAVSGSVALFHAVGITPEAPTEEAAFGNKKARDWQTVQFGARELRETKQMLSRAKAREVDIVILGCPHSSITEVRDIARLLVGKKVATELWVGIPKVVKGYAEMLGYAEIIESSGAKFVCNACPHTVSAGFLQGRGPAVVATNAAKITLSCTAEGQDATPYFGSLEKCIAAALSGKWSG